MDLRIDWEWLKRRAKIEGDHEVSNRSDLPATIEKMESGMITSKNQLLDRLARNGGCIVCSGSASEHEIADARARGDFYVDEYGYGFILRSKEWLDRVHKRDGYMQPTG